MSPFKKDDEQLKNLFFKLDDYKSLAALLEITPKQLINHVYITPEEKKYISFNLQKKTGGIRKISAPNGNLKLIQAKLSYLLYLIYQPKNSTKGFVINESIVTNAKLHVKKRTILNIDIEDFFGAINFGRVYGLFLKKPFSFDKKIAAVLAHICCFKNSLPQGAPTSPIITNMICAGLDRDFQKLAQKFSLVYSRYADGITFSTNFNIFPQPIAKGKLSVVEVGETVNNLIVKHGFTINDKKSRINYYYHRQVVTGIIVNKIPNVQRRYIRNLRGIIHSIEKFGYEAAEKEFHKRYSKQKLPSKNLPRLVNFLYGKLSFLAQVRGKESTIYISTVKCLRRLLPTYFVKPLNKLEELQKTFLELDRLHSGGKAISKVTRGFIFETFIKELFEYFKIEISKGFKRKGAEQIDGAIRFETWHYLVECKWKKEKSNTREVDALQTLIGRSGSQTSGIFIAINGWSSNVIINLQRNHTKNIILFNRKDIEDVLNEKVGLAKLLQFKIQKLNFHSMPHAEWDGV